MRISMFLICATSATIPLLGGDILAIGNVLTTILATYDAARHITTFGGEHAADRVAHMLMSPIHAGDAAQHKTGESSTQRLTTLAAAAQQLDHAVNLTDKCISIASDATVGAPRDQLAAFLRRNQRRATPEERHAAKEAEVDLARFNGHLKTMRTAIRHAVCRINMHRIAVGLGKLGFILHNGGSCEVDPSHAGEASGLRKKIIANAREAYFTCGQRHNFADEVVLFQANVLHAEVAAERRNVLQKELEEKPKPTSSWKFLSNRAHRAAQRALEEFENSDSFADPQQYSSEDRRIAVECSPRIKKTLMSTAAQRANKAMPHMMGAQEKCLTVAKWLREESHAFDKLPQTEALREAVAAAHDVSAAEYESSSEEYFSADDGSASRSVAAPHDESNDDDTDMDEDDMDETPPDMAEFRQLSAMAEAVGVREKPHWRTQLALPATAQ